VLWFGQVSFAKLALELMQQWQAYCINLPAMDLWFSLVRDFL
jgi:hypothetical protein